MRHFTAELRERGFAVDYVALDSPDAPTTFDEAMVAHVAMRSPRQVVVMEPNEWSIRERVRAWSESLGVPVEMRDDTLFMATHDDFDRYVAHRRGVRLEEFYHEMRRRYGVLMDGDEPAGGQFNFDARNRARYAPDPERPVPPPPSYPPDDVTRAVLTLIEEHFPDHFGSLESFDLPVTRVQALHLLKSFIDEALPHFGAYEDAMVRSEWLLYHSLISHVQNLGLLTAEEVVRAVEVRYREGRMPINSAEGFIRQVLGWREYMRGVYWQQMPHMHDMNYFDHTRHLPSFYWTAETRMYCVAHAVEGLRARGYTHHIQRLMVLANWTNLAGVIPHEVNDWFWEVYIDAYDWVVTPNVIGMALYADGGYTASKPYLGSANYINSMSDYCQHCTYDPKKRSGEDACPFNYLYWTFLDRHKDKLRGNQRMRGPVGAVERKAPAELVAMHASAERFLAELDREEDELRSDHADQRV